MQYREISLESWPRRASFEHFRRMTRAAFTVAVRVDVTGLAARAKAQDASLWLAYHYAALTAANEIESFRQTISADGRVLEYTLNHASTTVLRDDGSFGFVCLSPAASLREFVRVSTPRVAQARQQSGPLFDDALEIPEAALLHMTTLPWFDFSAFVPARDQHDDRPKIGFGRIVEEGGRSLMAVSIDVHHALVDGVHVGRFVERLQALLLAT
jgi:chloramphenicol O-acetyltransferase type A